MCNMFQLMSVCASVQMEQLGYDWKNFGEIWYLAIFRKSTKKIQFSLKSDNNGCILQEDQWPFLIISRSVPLRMRNVSDKIVQKIKTHIFYSTTFSENRAIYEITWKNYGRAGQATDDNIIRCMSIACWITRATNKHSECVTHYFPVATVFSGIHHNVTLNPHCLLCHNGGELRFLWGTDWICMSFVTMSVSKVIKKFRNWHYQ